MDMMVKKLPDKDDKLAVCGLIFTGDNLGILKSLHRKVVSSEGGAHAAQV